MTINNRLDFCEQSYEVFSVRTWSFMVTFRAVSVNLIVDSIAPPIHGANGVLNLDSILSSVNVLVIFCWFSLFNAFLFSCSAATKLVLLSLLIKRSFPLREVNRRNARRKLSVEESPARSMSHALVVRHVYIKPKLFPVPEEILVPLRISTNNVPMKSRLYRRMDVL